MSDLPRFTQGSFGNLEWHHLNQVFDVIERAPVPLERKRDRPDMSLIYAIITGELASMEIGPRYSWREILRNPDTGGIEAHPSPRTSGTEDDPFIIPAMGISGQERINVGDLVLLRQESFRDGRRYAVIIGSGVSVGMYRIEGATSIGTGRWAYTGVPVAVSNGDWVNPGLQVTLYNGCENPVDSGNTIGVGTVKPSNTGAIRQRIRDNTVVLAVSVSGGLCFSIPNGYSFTCT